MVVAILWIVVIVALLALMIAWGGTIDDTSSAYTGTRPPLRRGRRGVASTAPR